MAFARFIRQPDLRHAGWAGVAAAIGLATQYGIAVLLVGLNLVCLFVFWREKRTLVDFQHWLLIQVLPGLVAAYLAIFVLSGQMAATAGWKDGYLAGYYWNGTLPGLAALVTAPEGNLIAFAFAGPVMLILTIIGALSFVLGVGNALATAFFVVPTLLTLALAMAGLYPYGGIRQDIFLTPMIYVMAAIGLAAICRLLTLRLSAVVGTVAAVTVAGWMLTKDGLPATLDFLRWQGGRQPMRLLTDALARRMQVGDVIYVYDGAVPAFGYYWRSRPESWIRGARHQSYLGERLAARQMPAVQREILSLIRQGRPFWVVITHIMGSDASELLRFIERSAPYSMEAGVPGTWLLHVTPGGRASGTGYALDGIGPPSP
jgi:hypothetical protein